MLKLVSNGDLIVNRLSVLSTRIKSVLSLKLLIAFAMLLTGAAHAQEITLPTVDIDGIDESSSGDAILIVIVKYVAKIVIWVCMIMAGFVGVRSILKSWSAQKNNDEGRWGAVVGDSIGSIIMIVFVIALGTWLLTFLN